MGERPELYGVDVGGSHAVVFQSSLPSTAMGEVPLEWVARCGCGATSADGGTPDGTLASARRWEAAHLGTPLDPAGLDRPDGSPDSYDAFLREAAGGE